LGLGVMAGEKQICSPSGGLLDICRMMRDSESTLTSAAEPPR
ncbi:MAG: hypothetical protein ACJA1L_001915, partial [Paracoccaceae bacterium]